MEHTYQYWIEFGQCWAMCVPPPLNKRACIQSVSRERKKSGQSGWKSLDRDMEMVRNAQREKDRATSDALST